jgi:tellurite resistance protein TerC
MEHPIIFWTGFHLLVFFFMAVDLLFFHRGIRQLKFKQAIYFSGFWIALALLFNLFVYEYFGAEYALQFFTGYLIEKSLSVDNLFVFMMIFLQFRIQPADQQKILFWGILGALTLRITLILAGVALIQQFHWMFYLFGAILLYSAIKLLCEKKPTSDPSQSFVYRTLSRILPVSHEPHKGQFFVRTAQGWKVTSLFIALLLVEFTDVIFALDSIPAIFAITTNPFIVYTSNIFAIMGLRALHFVLAPFLEKLSYFNWGLSGILLFVGFKMLTAELFTISIRTSLLVIVIILAVTVVASLKLAKKPSA